MCCANLLPHVQVFWIESQGLELNAKECFYGGEHCKVVPEILGLGLSFWPSVLREAIVGVWVLTIDQIGQVLWLIYKMSNYMSEGSLYTKIHSQELEIMGI